MPSDDLRRYGFDVPSTSLIVWADETKVFKANGSLKSTIFSKVVEDLAEEIDIREGTAINYAEELQEDGE